MITLAFYPLFVRYSTGIALLSSILKEWGIESHLVLLDQYESAEEFTPETPYVGFSCVTGEDYRLCIPFMRRAKELGKTVLLGGVWAGLGKGVDASVDWVCRGDGEKLPNFLLSGEEEDEMFKHPQIFTDLNSLPLPDYDMWWGVPFERGIPPLQGKRVLPYISSRGCPHRCTFCQIRHQPPGHRIRMRVKEDVEAIQAGQDFDILYFCDAQLPYYNAEWRESWGGLHIPFVCYIRADIKPEELDWLIERGMVACAFGVESGDEGFRNGTLLKGVTDEEIMDTVGILTLNSIFYIPFYMTGIPGDTFLTQTRTLKMIKRVGGCPIVWRYEDLTA